MRHRILREAHDQVVRIIDVHSAAMDLAAFTRRLEQTRGRFSLHAGSN